MFIKLIRLDDVYSPVLQFQAVFCALEVDRSADGPHEDIRAANVTANDLATVGRQGGESL